MRDCEVYKQFSRICHAKLLRNAAYCFFSLCILQINLQTNCRLPNCQVTKLSGYQIVGYQIVGYQIVQLPNC